MQPRRSRAVPPVDCSLAGTGVKRAAVGVLGSIITLTGIALLVLPGPGFVLIAAGLAVLATQFDWAAKPLDYAKGKAQQGVDEVKGSPLRAGLTIAFAVGLAVVGVIEIAGLDLPLVNLVSAILLIGSGLFLVGTVVYARRKGSPDASEDPAG